MGTGSQADSMPELVQRWQAALSGSGELDLSAARVLARRQYFFTEGGVAGAGAAWASRALLRANISKLGRDQWPEVLRAVGGTVLAVDEWVLEPRSLLASLGQGVARLQLELRLEHIKRDARGAYYLQMDDRRWQPRYIVLAAGAGNGELQSLHQQQLRPLAMVHAFHPDLPPFFGHCLGLSDRPKLTVSAPEAGHWYLGGELAESGVAVDDAEQCQRARALLLRLFPSLPWAQARLEVQRIDRAEPAQRARVLPNSAFVGVDANLFTCWPGKLVRAPEVGDKLLQILAAQRAESPAKDA